MKCLPTAYKQMKMHVSAAIVRKATMDDLDFLVKADLSDEGYSGPIGEMTGEEQQAHRHKITAFIKDEESHGSWVCQDRESGKTAGMILCRFRKRPAKDVDEYPSDVVFRLLADTVFPENGRFCEVFQLWVDPSYRRRGLGTLLKKELEAESLRRKITMIYTHTEEQNQHVLELNRRLGYQEVRRGPIWDEVIRVSLVKYLELSK